MERNRPVETSQPVKEDNLFKHAGLSGNFPIGSTKNMCSIYFLSGITGIFMSMVNNLCLNIGKSRTIAKPTRKAPPLHSTKFKDEVKSFPEQEAILPTAIGGNVSCLISELPELEQSTLWEDIWKK